MSAPAIERRVLIHAPRGRDADVIDGVLQRQSIPTAVCPTAGAFQERLAEGAAAAVVAEETLATLVQERLVQWLAEQPSWSELPFVVLATRQAGRRPAEARAVLRTLGNVMLLERPLNAETLASAVESAVRARLRQYQTRQHLHELHEARSAEERLNRQLEDRITARTHELAAANDRLMAEIAERERTQAAMVHMQKMEAIGRLTGGIAHDFNNVLQVVNMNLELLTRQSAEPAITAIAERARRASGRGAKLTVQLLTFARSRSLVPRLTEVQGLLRGMQELVSLSIGSTIQLEMALSPSPAWVKLDSSQLEMAMLNLAVNAKDAMPDGGRLTIGSRLETLKPDGLPEGRYLLVSVCDEGTGIAEHLLGKVFDPFFTTKPVGSGTGLGLSQVYGFAQQSGGFATLDSRVGEGTCVTIGFPVVAPPDATQDPEPSPGEASGRPLRILVVEDDAEVRRVLVESLRMEGHAVAAASDGMEGLQKLSRAEHDLMVVDYAMPHMNGAEMIRRARGLRPELPIILATGYADMAEVAKVLGTRSILIKPFDLDALRSAVSQATRGDDGGRPPQQD
ncbi:response regulator [Aquincola sp. MAHUQ-54]|uniref:histidine kinase n=1 Tax=Aquincola agrisoli TaxID=3119538 RepID=A0AAW9QCV7_9BURK